MEVDDEYSDEDYGELFKTYILNVSNDDLANFTSPGGSNNSDYSAQYEESTDLVTSWLFALNIVSGIGILTNSVLAFMIIVDFIIDKSMRFWTRHWLVLNSAITHVAFLGISIYIREFGRHKDQSDRNCLILQHTDKTIDFVTSLYLVIIAINVAGNIVKPTIPCGKKSILFWIFFILFIMVCANVGVLALFTMELDGLSHDLKCQVDVTLYLPARNVHLVAIVTFYIPFGLLLTLAFSSLICSCTPQRHLSLTELENNEYYIARKHAAIFIFITATAGFLLKLPYYLFQVPVLAYFVLAGLKASYYVTFFITHLMKLLFYILFPILCLCLKDIRAIYRKAVSN
ncbi:uncharacterized protein LOC132742460 [Ruditapes philippinarum]|uniref:uncharacterized protein LOC132742460 n=1 Tax=Ruditapes philippinarum TaxID=129788 RepID=UPI00295C2451|nr:uncharacterized protein LOC132742460 [Ruditapes philippinarum]